MNGQKPYLSVVCGGFGIVVGVVVMIGLVGVVDVAIVMSAVGVLDLVSRLSMQ